MTKSKFSTSSIAVLSTFMIHVGNCEQFFNAICVSEAAVTVMSPLTKI